MLLITDIITNKSIHPECPFFEMILDCENQHITRLGARFFNLETKIKELLGELNEKDWLKSAQRLVYLNTMPHHNIGVIGICNNISKCIENVSDYVCGYPDDFVKCVNQVGLFKTIIICSADILDIYIDDPNQSKMNLDLLYIMATLYYTKHFVETSWNSCEYLKEFTKLDLKGFNEVSELKPTPLLLEILMVFDTPHKFTILLEALKDTAPYFLRVIGGIDRDILDTCDTNLTKVLAVLNDALKGISIPTKEDIYNAVFNRVEGKSQKVINDVVAGTATDSDYYYNLRKFFGYCIYEEDLKPKSVKSF